MRSITTDVIAFAVSSGILNEYRAKNTQLDELIVTVSESPERWQSMGIDVSSPPTSALEMKPICEARLWVALDEPATKKLRVATKKLVDYCTEHPAADIWAMTFFSSIECYYGVFCGEVDGKLEAICVLVGHWTGEDRL